MLIVAVGTHRRHCNLEKEYRVPYFIHIYLGIYAWLDTFVLATPLVVLCFVARLGRSATSIGAPCPLEMDFTVYGSLISAKRLFPFTNCSPKVDSFEYLRAFVVNQLSNNT